MAIQTHCYRDRIVECFGIFVCGGAMVGEQQSVLGPQLDLTFVPDAPADLDGGLVERELVGRALQPPPHQSSCQRGMARQALLEAPVEHRHAHGLDDPPARADRECRKRVLAQPRPQYIACAKYLRAEAAVDADATNQQPVQQQQPDALAPPNGLPRVPVPGGEDDDARQTLRDRLLAPRRRNCLGQLGVLLQDTTELGHPVTFADTTRGADILGCPYIHHLQVRRNDGGCRRQRSDS